MWKSHFFPRSEKHRRWAAAALFLSLLNYSIIQGLFYNSLVFIQKLLIILNWCRITRSEWLPQVLSDRKKPPVFFPLIWWVYNIWIMFFGKYLKLKLHSCRIFFNLGVKSKSPKVEKVSVTVCKTLKLLQNIRNVTETAGKFWKIWFLLF